MKSPGFSSFRQLMDLWDDSLAEQDLENKVRSLVDGSEFVLFFKKDDNVFGSSEENRVTFARLKNPEGADTASGWKEEATFMAINLSNVVKGEPTQSVFAKKDLKKIEVLDRDDAFTILLKQAKSTDKPEPKKMIRLVIPKVQVKH